METNIFTEDFLTDSDREIVRKSERCLNSILSTVKERKLEGKSFYWLDFSEYYLDASIEKDKRMKKYILSQLENSFKVEADGTEEDKFLIYLLDEEEMKVLKENLLNTNKILFISPKLLYKILGDKVVFNKELTETELKKRIPVKILNISREKEINRSHVPEIREIEIEVLDMLFLIGKGYVNIE